jgi:hypothetical protein
MATLRFQPTQEYVAYIWFGAVVGSFADSVRMPEPSMADFRFSRQSSSIVQQLAGSEEEEEDEESYIH